MIIIIIPLRVSHDDVTIQRQTFVGNRRIGKMNGNILRVQHTTTYVSPLAVPYSWV